jgi:small subunit ribosomal protein S1
MTRYLPEGQRKLDYDWDGILKDSCAVQSLIRSEEILEAKAVSCDHNHNLCVALGSGFGIMPREECAIGIKNGDVREIAIISRVNRPVCFKVIDYTVSDSGVITPILSRTRAQEETIDYLLANKQCGDIINATVTHLESFGAFVDIGCGVSSLIATANLSVSRIDHPRARVHVGQEIKAIIREIDHQHRRFSLSQKELLGTWEENAAQFGIGCTVTGIVRSVEPYGVFIELAPNLSGLAEYSGHLDVNTQCAVYIKNIIPERMKIKLSVINAANETAKESPLKYFITGGSLRRWTYSPAGCSKVIETVF